MNLGRAKVCAHLEHVPLWRLSVRSATVKEFDRLGRAPSAGSRPACLASVRLLYSTDGAGSDVGSGERQLLGGLCAGELDVA